MARITPGVENGRLYAANQGDAFSIPLSSEQWYAWLEQHRTFRVKCSTVSYTARKEQRAGRWYWYAYRRHAGKLRIVYLGKSSELTLERLERAALSFIPSAPSPKSSKYRAPSPKGRSVSAQPGSSQIQGNLPLSLTSFVGRSQEITDVLQLLSYNRLVTLTGTGGIGKTRLALHSARLLADRFPGGIWFAELAGTARPDALLPLLATTLGAQPRTDQEMLLAIQMAFQSRPTLLILDNCEHLLDACAHLIEQLLTSCPTLIVLATSREMLCIPGEAILLVSPLSLPVQREVLLLDQVCQSEAVQLFLERARSVQPSFTLSQHNISAVMRVCCHLDGIPLALELAATCLRLMPVEQLANVLEHELYSRFRLLTHGKRTAAARHHTLLATLDWSYQLLSPPEQLLLQRLSIFMGGCTLEAAAAICSGNGINVENMLDLLGKLVHKSLVLVREESLPMRCTTATPRELASPSATQRRARYYLLETIRQYGREKLNMIGEEHTLLYRYMTYFLQLAQQADLYMRGPDQLTWLECLDHENDNLEAVLQAAIQHEPALALSLASALTFYWNIRAQFIKGRQHLEAALAASEGYVDSLRAHSLYRASLLHSLIGDFPRSEQCAEEGLALFRTLGDRHGIGLCLSTLVEVACRKNEYQQALALGRECTDLLIESGDDWTLAIAYFSLATIHMHQGSHTEMLFQLQESVRLMRKLGDRWGLALACNCMGRVHGYLGRYEEAITFFEESVRLAQEIGDSNSVALGRHALAISWLRQQEYARAQQQLDEVRAQYEQNGHLSSLAEVLRDQGTVAMYREDFSQAQLCLERSATLYNEQGNQIGAMLSYHLLGRVAVMQHDAPHALDLLRSCFSFFAHSNQRRFMAACLESLAGLSILLHIPRQGARWLGQAQSLCCVTSQQRSLIPASNAYYEATLATLQEQLSKEVFEIEVAAGQALSLQQIMLELEALTVSPEPVSDTFHPHRKRERPAPNDLTEREIEVLRLLASGMRNSDIAQQLSISSGTVRTHLSAIYSKLAVHSRTAAAHAARLAKLL